MPSIDDEEETLCLLADQEESPGPRHPGGASSGSVASYNQITPSVAWKSNGITTSAAEDVDDKPLVQLKSDELTSIANESYLAPGTAERTFFSVCGSNATARGYTAGDTIDDDEEDEDSDEEGEQRKHLINDQPSPTCVRASIKVVNEILTDIEDGADFRSHTAVEAESAHSVSTSTSRSLVVDVHLPPDDHILRPYKHEINRFQRCYSDGSQSSPKRKGVVSVSSATTSAQIRLQDESLQRSSQNKSSLDNDSFQNADKIETIYETDTAGQLKQKRDARFRHSSECTGFGSLPFESTLRGFNFHEEFINLRHNLFEGRQLFFGSGNSDNGSKRKSDSEVDGKAFRSDDLSSSDKCNRYLSEDQSKNNLRLGPAFSSFPSAALANSSVIVSTPSPGMSDTDMKSKNANPSPYTFFTMESDDDFDFDGGDKSFEVMDDHPRFSVDFDDHKSTISQSSSTVSLPVCRICQLPSMEPNNHLISPCRCLGSIRYVHNNCLLKWLEVSSKRRNGPACCELCQYQYLRHKKFVITHWRFPECSLKDKILHLFFVISVCLMIACAAVTIICFKEDRGHYRGSNKYHAGELSPPEMITLSCGVLFFLAFFLAMYVEVKARHTVYQLICKFFYLNHEWSVEEYDRKRDLVISKKKKEKLKKKKADNTSTNRNTN